MGRFRLGEHEDEVVVVLEWCSAHSRAPFLRAFGGGSKMRPPVIARTSLLFPFWGVTKSGCDLSSWTWGQECPQNPQAGKPALRGADILVCGFGRLSSRPSLTHFNHTPRSVCTTTLLAQ